MKVPLLVAVSVLIALPAEAHRQNNVSPICNNDGRCTTLSVTAPTSSRASSLRERHTGTSERKPHRVVDANGNSMLVTVPTAYGFNITVHPAYASKFLKFFALLKDRGYKVQANITRCWAPRGTHVAGSNHYIGAACDIQTGRAHLRPLLHGQLPLCNGSANLAIEYRWAEGRTERFREIAAEFVRLKVDVIVTAGSAVPAVMQATSTIPIVFAIAVDPLGSGMVASLARPGGNVTGLSLLSAELASKRIELLRDVLPNLSRLAVIANVGSRGAVLELAEVRAVARKFNIDIEALEIRRAEDIAPAFAALKNGAQALYVCPDALVNANYVRINTFALAARLPTIHAFRDFVGAAGLMSYGASSTDLFRRSGDIVDKILKGAKPADLPVEQPTKFELV